MPTFESSVEHLQISEQIDRAQLIVVGTVEKELSVRKAEYDSGVAQLELMEVHLAKETTIKGDFSGEKLIFYYYKVLGGWNGPPPNRIYVGGRAIFYLQPEGHFWRAATDGYLSNTPIHTAKQNVENAATIAEVRKTIGRLLILPPPYDSEEGLRQYLVYLHKDATLAADFVGVNDAKQMLRTLLASSSHAVRGRACTRLATFPLGDFSCLDDLLADPKTLPKDREEGQEIKASLLKEQQRSAFHKNK